MNGSDKFNKPRLRETNAVKLMRTSVGQVNWRVFDQNKLTALSNSGKHVTVFKSFNPTFVFGQNSHRLPTRRIELAGGMQFVCHSFNYPHLHTRECRELIGIVCTHCERLALQSNGCINY